MADRACKCELFSRVACDARLRASVAKPALVDAARKRGRLNNEDGGERPPVGAPAALGRTTARAEWTIDCRHACGWRAKSPGIRGKSTRRLPAARGGDGDVLRHPRFQPAGAGGFSHGGGSRRVQESARMPGGRPTPSWPNFRTLGTYSGRIRIAIGTFPKDGLASLTALCSRPRRLPRRRTIHSGGSKA